MKLSTQRRKDAKPQEGRGVKCEACNKNFVPLARAWIVQGDTDVIEVHTKCQHCNEEFYTFINPEQWASERKAQQFIRHLKKKGQVQ